MAKDGNKKPEQNPTSKLNISQISKAAQNTLYKSFSNAVNLDKYKPGPHSELSHTSEKAGEVASDLMRDFLAIGVTQPAVSAITYARRGLNEKPNLPPTQALSDSFKEWAKKPIHNSYNSEIGRFTAKTRMRTYVAVNSVADSAMSDVLPTPNGVKNLDDASSVFVRSMAKAGIETIANIYSEAHSLKESYQSKQTLPQVTKNIMPGASSRNFVIWAGIELAKAQSETPAQAAAAGAAYGIASGFVAGIIDNKITFNQVASMAQKSAAKASPSGVLAAGIIRAVQAGVTAGALASASEIQKTMSQKDKDGKALDFNESDVKNLQQNGFDFSKLDDIRRQDNLWQRQVQSRAIEKSEKMSEPTSKTAKSSFAEQAEKKKIPTTGFTDAYTKQQINKYLERESQPSGRG